MFKRFFKSFAVAFSMYSKIPMPGFNWASDDMKYHLCFFPLIGAVIGALELGWYFLFSKGLFNIGPVLYYSISIVLPLLVTGGFHLDGFMDTMDALNSYGNREKKLEILKDPHIGAFSVISLVVLLFIAVGFASQLHLLNSVIAVSFSFFISRTLSGLSVLCFPKAKKEGMVYTESSTEGKRAVKAVLFAEFLLGSVGMLYFTLSEGLQGIFVLAAIVLSFARYFFMSKKHFGGITGDLSGWFVTVSETAAVVSCGICEMSFC